MKKVAFLVLITLSAVARSQTITTDISESSQNNALYDTICLHITDTEGMNFEHESFILETHQIPAYALYGQIWDTKHLRSKQFTIPFSNDMLKIVLVESYNSPFVFPCRGTVLLPYGPVRRSSFHVGVDFKLNEGDPVYACFDGVVRLAKYYGDYGKMVTIRHYNGLETVYAHLSKIYVKPGQIIRAGHTLGTAGSTGNTKEVCLHFETRFLNEYFDPELMLNGKERSLNSNILTLEPSNFSISPIPPKSVLPLKNDPVVNNNKNRMIENNAETKPEKSQIMPGSNQKESVKKAEYHTVKQGETFYKISKEYNITINKLLEMNNLTEKSILRVGQKLRIK